MSKPLVSVIVPTKNSASTLEDCLKSVRSQSYDNIELIVVDNYSNDATANIAKKYADKFFQRGPERSAQRNYGVEQASGKFVAIIDSDMNLSQEVINECVNAIRQSQKNRSVIIPEESFGEGFWAQCKKLERSFYIGVDWLEAARFFNRKDYLDLGGYNVNLTSGEDWDLSNRMKKLGDVARIKSFIFHNEGRIKLHTTLKKKAYYASKINQYLEANTDTTSTSSEILKVFKRFGLYFSRPGKLFRNPILGLGMLFMKIMEFAYSFIFFLKAKLQSKH